METIYWNTRVSDELATRLLAMPKAELHVHLEGATNAATIWELARRNEVTLPASTQEEWASMYEFRDFDHFIEIYLRAMECIKTPEDLAYMTEQFLKGQAQHHVRYCEAFISVSLLPENLLGGEAIAALIEAAKRGKDTYGIELHFIPDIARHLPETRHRVLDYALRGKESGIFVGLCIGSTEHGFPPELFADVYAEARRQDLHVVAHAGETVGPESVWGAITSLHVERIGHGIRSLEDQKLVDYLRQSQIPLEVSPHSNYRLKIVPIDQPHPIRALYDQGVYVTVNSDDPAMFSSDLTSEYVLLARQGFNWDELWQLNLNTLNASFLTEEAKDAYRSEWKVFAA
jgi:adenosine deaminase